MKSIINKKNVDTTKQPLFFGEELNLQRYDRYRYKKLFDLFLQQMSFFWRPETSTFNTADSFPVSTY